MAGSFAAGAVVAGAAVAATQPPLGPAVTETMTTTITETAIDENQAKLRVYRGIRGLAELPYFEVAENGLLRLTLDDLEGGIDGHIHFALNALAGPRPDLLKSYPETKYYIDLDDELSLDNYMAEN